MTAPDMMYRLTSVEALEDMRVRASFSDGYSCIYDARPRIESDPRFAHLKDPRAFSRAFIEGNCLCWHTPLEAMWPLAVDIEAAEVYEDGEPYDFSYNPGRLPKPNAPERAAASRAKAFIYH